MTKNVSEYYNLHCHEEDQRLSGNSMEYLMTFHLIEKYAPNAKTACDIGGATGVYAIPLALSGKDVCLCDISQKEIDLAIQKAVECGVKLQVKKCDVFTDDLFLGKTFDLILCLGPLYHCHNERDVREVLSKISLIMHSGSVAILAFLSKYAKLNKTSRKTQIDKDDMRNLINFHNFINESNSGLFIFREKPELPISYVVPEQISPFLKSLGFIVEDVVAADVFEKCAPTAEYSEIVRFTELAYQLGRSAKLNDGNHIIVVIKK